MEAKIKKMGEKNSTIGMYDADDCETKIIFGSYCTITIHNSFYQIMMMLRIADFENDPAQRVHHFKDAK